MKTPEIAKDLSARAQADLDKRQPGAKVAIAGRDAYLAGESSADGSVGRDTWGVRVWSDRIALKELKPYVFDAARDGDGLVLTGFVPSQAVKDQVGAAAARIAGKVDNRLQIARGGGEGFSAAALAALAPLTTLRKGEANLTDGVLTLTGRADDAAGAQGALDSLKSLPGAVKLGAVKIEPDPARIAAEKAAAAKAEADRQAALKADADKAAAAKAEADRQAALKADADKAAAAKAEADRQAALKADADKAAAAKAEADRQAALKADADKAAAAKPAEPYKAPASGMAAAGCPKPGQGEAAAGRVLFNTGSARLSEEGDKIAQEVAKMLVACPNYRIQIYGFTDSVGDPEANKLLAQRRANSVVRILETEGVDLKRIDAQSFGEGKPVGDNDTEAGRAENRRIEITVK